MESNNIPLAEVLLRVFESNTSEEGQLVENSGDCSDQAEDEKLQDFWLEIRFF